VGPSQLVAKLGVTQGHLSKVKRGLVPGSRKLPDNLESVGATPRRAPEPWLDLVRQAGSKSRDAKIAIEAIVRGVLKARQAEICPPVLLTIDAADLEGILRRSG
jgi:hypothetical protein